MIEFYKMNACGNDFLVIDNRKMNIELSKDQIIFLADYKRSIGFDQLMVIENSNICDISIKIFNKDGSKAAACGNGTRCVAYLILNQTSKKNLTIETSNRNLIAKIENEQISLLMGKAEIIGENLNFDGLIGAHIDVGNEHVVINFTKGGSTDYKNFVKFDVGQIGPKIENDIRFPEKVNVNFTQVINRNLVALKTWERGAGETLSCGSGACASFYFLYSANLINSPCIIRQAGGDLEISIEGNEIFMKGEANISYYGSINTNLIKIKTEN